MMSWLNQVFWRDRSSDAAKTTKGNMKIVETPPYKAGLIGIAATVGALGAMALGNLYLARKAKEENPPEGQLATRIKLATVALGNALRPLGKAHLLC